MRRGFLATFLILLLTSSGPLAAQQPPPEKAGFPFTLPGGGASSFSQPALADLKITGGKAGVKSIVFGSDQGELHVIYQLAGGTWGEAPGFPVAVGGSIVSSPAVGDLDDPQDGIPELVVGYGPSNGSQPGGVKAFRNNGTLLWSRPSLDVGIPDGRADPVVGTPAMGDVDGDGKNDVIWGATDFRIYFVNGKTGADKPNWPRHALDSILSSPVLHDMDGDGWLEIIVGVDAHADATFGTPNGGCIHVIPATQPLIGATFPSSIGYPQNLPGFPKCVDQVISSAPAVGDIDGDGRPEIMHGTGNFYGSAAAPGFTPSERVYAWKCDGTAVAGWPVAISGQMQFNTSPALANLDGDAALEVVVTSDNTRSSSTFHVYAFKGNGTLMPGWPAVPESYFGTTLNAANPVIADVDGATSDLEILVPTNTEVALFSTTGWQLTDNGSHTGLRSFYTPTAIAGVAVAELDSPSDGRIDVVVVSAAPFPSSANTEIHVWNPVSRSAIPPWGMFRQDASRRGVAPGTGPCGSGPSVSTTLLLTDSEVTARRSREARRR